MSFWKKLFNPIDAAWSEVGAGAGDFIDTITGKEGSKQAAKSGREARETQLRIHQENIDLQKEFAQHGIKWRVDDAVRAGIHPLAAIGAAGASYNPAIPVIDPLPSARSWRDTLGQNVRGFFMSKLDPVNRALNNLTVERAGLENDLLRLQILNASKGQAGSPDPYLSGQGDSLKGNPVVIDEPLRRVVSDPMDPSKEVGAIQDWQMVRTDDGGYAVVPGKNVKQAIEDSPMEYQWLIRAAKRTYKLPDGRSAKMNPFTGKLIPVKRRPWWNYFFGHPDKHVRED